jgi:hypothetical protein
MNPDTLGAALKEMAERWDTPTFEPETLAQHSQARTRRTRRRVLAGAATVAIAATGAVAAVSLSGNQNNSSHSNSMRPAAPPPVRITAVDTTSERIDGAPVLARVSTGASLTVHAKLSFVGNRPAGVKDAALLVAKPGTLGGVSGSAVDSYFRDRGLELARGSFVTATSPEQRMLSVQIPRDLPPGQYPVFSVFRSVLMPGEERGIYGPFDVSSQLGVIVITGK